MIQASPLLRRLAIRLRPGAVAVLAALGVSQAVAEEGLSVERQRELVHLVRQDCGACHGMTLKGGLGPPLTPDALRDKPPDSLVSTVLMGRPGTPMPPWGRFLGEADARWIVEQLRRGFP